MFKLFLENHFLIGGFYMVKELPMYDLGKFVSCWTEGWSLEKGHLSQEFISLQHTESSWRIWCQINCISKHIYSVI